MIVKENTQFTRDYLDPGRRFIGNAVQVFFADGSRSERVAIDYPVGHRRRRAEGIPLLMAKCEAALRGHLPAVQADRLLALAAAPEHLDRLAVDDLMGLCRVA